MVIHQKNYDVCQQQQHQQQQNTKKKKNKKLNQASKLKSSWTSIKTAKDEHMDPISNKILLKNNQYQGSQVPKAFAAFFTRKVNVIPNTSTIYIHTYIDGSRAVIV